MIDREDIKALASVLVPVAIVFATTLLLDWQWILQKLERRILVWLLILVEIFIFLKIYNVINKNQK